MIIKQQLFHSYMLTWAAAGSESGEDGVLASSTARQMSGRSGHQVMDTTCAPLWGVAQRH